VRGRNFQIFPRAYKYLVPAMFLGNFLHLLTIFALFSTVIKIVSNQLAPWCPAAISNTWFRSV